MFVYRLNRIAALLTSNCYDHMLLRRPEDAIGALGAWFTIGRTSGSIGDHVMDRGESRSVSIHLDPPRYISAGFAHLVRSVTLNSIYSFDILQYSNGL
jgi:hypothetical protein